MDGLAPFILVAGVAVAAACGECVVGESLCIHNTPVRCYREHNEDDEFEPPAWHDEAACVSGYVCRIPPELDGATCIYGDASYPGCPRGADSARSAEQAICEGDLLVRCDHGYRTSHEMCTTCEAWSDSETGYGAECTELVKSGRRCTRHDDCISEHCVDGKCVEECNDDLPCDAGQRCVITDDLYFAYCAAD